MSRPQVVKKIWEYVKERNLQNPDDKRQIMCDEKLQAVFKQDSVHMVSYAPSLIRLELGERLLKHHSLR